MTHPTTIRTAFASADDAAKIYGISSKRVKELRKLLSRLNGQKSSSARKRSAMSKKAGKSKAVRNRRTVGRRTTRRAA